MFTLILIVLINIGNAITINATRENSTHQYFVTSEHTDQVNYFTNGIIICTTPFCHIICDKKSSCIGSKVYANSTNTTTLTLQCHDDFACNQAEIYAPEVDNVAIICDDQKFSYEETCKYLMVDASYSNNVYFYFERTDSAQFSRLYVNNSGSVTVKTAMGGTSGATTLEDAVLYGYNIRNLLNITCDGYGCYKFTVYADNMASSSTFNILCYELDACRLAEIHCPLNTDCNIECGLSDSCEDLEIYVGADNYTGLNLQCGRYACGSTTLYCDTDPWPYSWDSGSSILSYNYLTDTIRCGYPTARCCPEHMRYIECDPDTTCQVDCADVNCGRQIINATLATSLVLDCAGYDCELNICSGSHCDGSTVLCPFGNGTSCIIKCNPGSCQYLSVERKGNNIMDRFSLNCYLPIPSSTMKYYDGFCYRNNLDLEASLIKEFFVDCQGSHSCREMIFNLDKVAAITDYSLICRSKESCHDIHLDINTPTIQDLSVQCIGNYQTYSCRYLSWSLSSTITNQFNLMCRTYGCIDMTLNISSPKIPLFVVNCSDSGCGALGTFNIITTESVSIDTLSIMCPEGASCGGITLAADNSIVKDLTMDCVSCAGINIDTQISNSATINCTRINSCEAAEVKLVSATDTVNFDIMCRSPDFTGHGYYDEGSCYNSKWYFYGYESNNVNNNLMFECDGLTEIENESKKDCEDIEIHGYNLNKSSIYCRDNQGCTGAVINMATVQTLDLHCLGKSSCSGTQLYCPYEHENACHVTCAGYYKNTWDNMRHSCAAMDVIVPDLYALDYLDLYCTPSEPDAVACSGLQIDCSGIRETANYVWDDVIQDYRCNNTLPKYCCPYFDNNVIKCEYGKQCNVDCMDNNCSAAIIDGTDATYLSLNCEAYECEKALVLCPMEGCSIQCYGEKSCFGTYFKHMGSDNILIQNGTIDINCTAYRACENVLIEANFIDKIEFICTATYYNKHVCSTEFNAMYANEVIINANERYSSYYDTFNVQNAKSVTLSGKGYWAIYNSILNANDARSVTLSFYSFTPQWSTYYTTKESQWYLPYDTTINCHGTGCYNLGKIYRYNTVSNASGLYLYLDTCAQCDGIADCIANFEIRCDGGYAIYDSTDYPTELCNDNDCGCQDIFKRVDILSNYSNRVEKCYQSKSPTKATTTTPTNPPTLQPSELPTTSPITLEPTISPITLDPSVSPSNDPSSSPSKAPTNNPSIAPTSKPTKNPLRPGETHEPSTSPSYNPSVSPTDNPSVTPTEIPSDVPSMTPSENPSGTPSQIPTKVTLYPTMAPYEITTTSKPTTTPTFCNIKEYVNNLEFVMFYNDNNPSYYESYFSLLVYSNLMINAILKSIRESSSDYPSICDFQMCSVFNTDIDKNCSSYEFDDGTPFRWAYIAFGAFRMNKFKEKIIKLMNSDDFMGLFTKNMNNLLNDFIDSDQNRRNLLANNFETISIIVFDSAEKDETAHESSDDNDNSTLIIVVVVIILILIIIAIGIAIYWKKRKDKTNNNEIGDNANEAIQLTNTDTPNETVNITATVDTEGTADCIANIKRTGK